MNKYGIICLCLLLNQIAWSQSCKPDPVLRNPFLLLFFDLTDEKTEQRGLNEFKRLCRKRTFVIGKRKYSPENYPLIYSLASAMKALSNQDTQVFKSYLNLADTTYRRYVKRTFTDDDIDVETNFFQKEGYLGCARTLMEKLRAKLYVSAPPAEPESKPEIEPEHSGAGNGGNGGGEKEQPDKSKPTPPEKKQPDKPKPTPPVKPDTPTPPKTNDNDPSKPALVEYVFFKTDSFSVNLAYRQNKAALNKIVDILKGCNDCKVLLTGFTDDSGPVKYNEWLSENRSKSVGIYLKEHGVDGRRIEEKYYGKLGSGSNNARKVEIAIYGSVEAVKP